MQIEISYLVINFKIIVRMLFTWKQFSDNPKIFCYKMKRCQWLAPPFEHFGWEPLVLVVAMVSVSHGNHWFK